MRGDYCVRLASRQLSCYSGRMDSRRTRTVAGVVVHRHLPRTVLITGGTDGLGSALADAYRDAGWRVLVVGRTARSADPARFICCDLSEPFACRTIVAALDARGVDTLDLIIHSAAAATVGQVEDCPDARIEQLVTVNVWSPIALTQALLPRVRAVRGKIAFIGSVAAFAPSPKYAIYAATKAALDGFARALAHELRDEVQVQIVHPGPIRTAFHSRSGFTDLDTSRFPTASRVAAQVIRAIDRGRWRAFVDLPAGAIAAVSRLLPAAVDWAVTRRFARGGTVANGGAPRDVNAGGAIVTGAGSGLGESIAARLLQQGRPVLGVDRNRATAHGVGDNDKFDMHVADLAQRKDLDQLNAALQRLGESDLLVHCAGTSAVGAFAGQSLESLRTVLWTNFVAPMMLTARALERTGLVSAGTVSAPGASVSGGKGGANVLDTRALAPVASIVFVSSLSHFVGYPGAAVYAASKDGLAHFARSLRIALAPRGMNCLTVFPGPMRTPHAQRFAPPGASAANRIAPEVVADALLSAVSARRARLIPGAGARLAALFGSIAPGLSTRIMARTLYRRLAALPIATEQRDESV